MSSIRTVFISGLIGKEGGAPQLGVEALGDDELNVVVSPQLIAELEAVLARPKFAAQTTPPTGRLHRSHSRPGGPG